MAGRPPIVVEVLYKQEICSLLALGICLVGFWVVDFCRACAKKGLFQASTHSFQFWEVDGIEIRHEGSLVFFFPGKLLLIGSQLSIDQLSTVSFSSIDSFLTYQGSCFIFLY